MCVNKTNHTMSRDHISTILCRHNVPFGGIEYGERQWMWLYEWFVLCRRGRRGISTLHLCACVYVILRISCLMHSDINLFVYYWTYYYTFKALSMYLTSYISQVEDAFLRLLRMKCESQKQHSTKLCIITLSPGT